MKTSHYGLRLLIESILLEGVEQDRKDLARKFEEYDVEINKLTLKGISWLASQFDLKGSADEGEKAVFYTSLTALRSFIENEKTITGNSKKLVAAGFANPSDLTGKTAEDLRKIVAAVKEIKEKKRKTVDVEVASNPRADVIATIDGWEISVATSRENSCALGKENPNLCTTRSAGNNLWADYIFNSTLFLFTRVGLEGKEAWNNMFVWTFGKDCKPRYGGQDSDYGSETVDGKNYNIQEKDIRARLGDRFDEIKSLLTKKCREWGGNHPAYAKVLDAAKSVSALEALSGGIKGDDLSNLLVKVARLEVTKEVEDYLLTKSDSRVKEALASNKGVSPETLKTLAEDPDKFVSRAAKMNPNFPLEEDPLSSNDPDTIQSLAKRTQDLSIMRDILQKKKGKEFERARAEIAIKSNLTDDLKTALKEDPSELVRAFLIDNVSLEVQDLIDLFEKDPVLRNKMGAIKKIKFPALKALEILRDPEQDQMIKIAALSRVGKETLIDGEPVIDIIRGYTSDLTQVGSLARNIYARLSKAKNESRLRKLIRLMI